MLPPYIVHPLYGISLSSFFCFIKSDNWSEQFWILEFRLKVYGPRYLLSQLATWYLIPLISSIPDMGYPACRRFLILRVKCLFFHWFPWLDRLNYFQRRLSFDLRSRRFRFLFEFRFCADSALQSKSFSPLFVLWWTFMTRRRTEIEQSSAVTLLFLLFRIIECWA